MKRKKKAREKRADIEYAIGRILTSADQIDSSVYVPGWIKVELIPMDESEQDEGDFEISTEYLNLFENEPIVVRAAKDWKSQVRPSDLEFLTMLAESIFNSGYSMIGLRVIVDIALRSSEQAELERKRIAEEAIARALEEARLEEKRQREAIPRSTEDLVIDRIMRGIDSPPEGVRRNVYAARKREITLAAQVLQHAKPSGGYKSKSERAFAIVAFDIASDRYDARRIASETGLSPKTISRIASTIRKVKRYET